VRVVLLFIAVSGVAGVVEAGQAAATARAPVRHEVVVDGHRLVVWQKKPAQAARAIVVLLHGRTWSSLPNYDLQVPGERRSFMDALAGGGLDVYAVDFRGYGATARDASGWLTPDRAVADVLAVLAWIPQRPAARLPVYLFGLSRGAMIAAMAAQQRPETIAGVILFGFGFDPDAQIQRVDPPSRPPRSRNTADAASSDFITPDAYTGATLTAFVRAALKADPVLVDWRDEHQFNAYRPAQMQVPALLVHGDRDPQAPLAVSTKLFTRFATPDKAWVIIPGADHAAHLEKAQVELVRVILWFIRRHEV
jgi:alpha-beta hydrolase superfamily lysophospholipase